MRQLSGGMKRRVLVAQALVHRPPVIVLDEPTAGVDVELRQTLWQFIAGLNKQGHTVLLTTHYLEEAEALCGRIAMLKTGPRGGAGPHRQPAGRHREHDAALQAPTIRCRSRMAAQARVTGRIAQVTAHDAAEVETLLGRLRAAGVKVEELEIGRADLEDVFLEIMAKERSRMTGAMAAPCSTRRCCASGRWPSRPWPRRC
jgi:ABC-2 type transport system ATP-binding protein